MPDDGYDFFTPDTALSTSLEKRGADPVEDPHTEAFALREIERLYRTGRCPIEPDSFSVVVVDYLSSYAQATIIPYGVRYFPAEYEISDEPEGFYILIRETGVGSDYEVRRVVRHEVAHAIDWWKHNRTDEESPRFHRILKLTGGQPNGSWSI